jgi:hypothetical protein
MPDVAFAMINKTAVLEYLTAGVAAGFTEINQFASCQLLNISTKVEGTGTPSTMADT